MNENSGSNPRASFATLAAGFAGTPVCVDVHMTQMAMADTEKKSRVNQSISAATLRRNVGRAKAARAASAGRPSNSARSAGWVV
ncbi:MAG: hypothetical protein KDE69_12910, partial [Burkholderiaceae bacterium]|nr:hypothetical protein [Burkholderiaceae bacterium]